MSRPLVTALGGGHGLSASLRALRLITDRLVAVVTVADNGGSSGRLRRELGGLPPGDLRMALAALCGDDPAGEQWAEVLQSRFHSSGPLDGHAIGNLLIEGIWQQLDAVPGLDMVAELLKVRGRVLPMALEPLTIEADVIGAASDAPDEVSVVSGQHEVAVTAGNVVSVRLVPSSPQACPEAIRSVDESEYLVLGPGSWFTSVLPHLLVPELAHAIIESQACRILTLNIQADSETKGLGAAQHLDILAEHAPQLRFDFVIADASFDAGDRTLRTYAESLGAELVVADVACHDGALQHDPTRLGQVFTKIMNH